MEKKTLDLYFTMQNLNRATIKYAAGMIQVGMRLPEIKALCEVLKRITFGEIMQERLYLKMAYYAVKPTKSKITKNKNDRIYTEKGNHKRLSDVEMFTFEPHISITNSKYGYKREDIYYFNNGRLIKL